MLYCCSEPKEDRSVSDWRYGAMKRKYALAAALVGALVLPLCSCAGGIEGKARQYLSSRYSGEFTITDAERITNETGPIPVLIPSYH